MVEVTRIQYPVGQGCFHVGSIEWRRQPEDANFHYVYDCGSKNKTALTHSVKAMAKRLSRIDALFVSHLHEDHVNGLDQLLGAVRVNTVFIPHLSVSATVAGLVADAADTPLSHSLVDASLDPQRWFGERGVSHIVRVRPPPPGKGSVADAGSEGLPPGREPQYAEIDWDPREARDGDLAKGPADLQWMESGEMLAPGPEAQTLDWVLVPHVDPELQIDLTRFEGEVANVLGLPDLDNLTTRQLADALRDPGQCKSLRGCYIRCFGANHNRVSMSVYSGPNSDPNQQHWSRILPLPLHFLFHRIGVVGWIGTGDAELKDHQVRGAWERSYRKFLPNLSTLLLPHHGSDRNFSPELLKYQDLACCVASAGDPSQYSHPGVEVIESVRLQGRIFRHVSERPGTLFCERIQE